MHSRCSRLSLLFRFAWLTGWLLAAAGLVAQPTINNPTSSGSVVELGQSVSFGISAFGTAPLSYRWQKNGAALADGPSGTGSSFAGTGTPVLTITSTTAQDAGSFAATVTDGNGAGTTSTVFTLTVKPGAAPVITVPPANLTVVAGGNAAFTVTGSGSYPRIYQWFHGTAALPNSNSNPLTVIGVSTSDAGAYSVTVSNSYGSVTSSAAALTVTPATPPSSASIFPTSTLLYAGQSLSLSGSAFGGSSPYTYQWFKNGTPIAGATNGSYSVPVLALSDAGSYTFAVSNVAGSATSPAVAVTVLAPVAPTINSQSPSSTLAYGAALSLSVNASGSPTLTYQWSKDGQAISGATASSYFSSPSTAATAGTYTVVITNGAGSVTAQPVVIQVAPVIAPAFTLQPTGGTILQGGSFTFNAAATGSAPLIYQWMNNGQPVPGGTGPSLSLNSATAANAGTYTLVVTGPGGSATSQGATLIVAAAQLPTFSYGNGGSLSTTVGSGAAFFAPSLASGSPPYSYQWYKNGSLLAGATGSSYNLNTVQAGDVGDYQVVITNGAGSIAGPPTHLTIASGAFAPWLDAQQQGFVVYFLFTQRIERYDLAANQWLASTPLAQTATALTVSGTAIFVASAHNVVRYSLDLGSQVSLFNTTGSIQRMFTNGTYLYVLASSTFGTSAAIYDQSTGASLGTPPATFNSAAVTVAPRIGRAFQPGSFGLSTYNLAPAGAITVTSTQNNPNWDFSVGPRTILFPDSSLLVDNGGNVYSTSGPAPVGTFGGAIDDVAFLVDGSPVTLRGNLLRRFGTAPFNESGRVALAQTAFRLFGFRSTVVAFSSSTANPSGIGVSIVDAALFVPATSSAVLDAAKQTLAPSAMVMDKNGVAYLFNSLAQIILPWSPATRSYQSPIALSGAALSVTYSASLHRLYVAYQDGRVTKIDLGQGTREQPFTNLPGTLVALNACDSYLHAVIQTPSTSEQTSVLFDTTGALVSYGPFTYYPSLFSWCSANQAFYVAGPAGILSAINIRSPGTIFQSNNPTSNSDVCFPSPDGSLVATDAGLVRDGLLLAPVGAIANSVSDGAWINHSLYTLRAGVTGTEVQAWAPNTFLLTATAELPGAVGRIFALPGQQLLAITISPHGAAFTIFDQNLQVLAQSGALAVASGTPQWITQPAPSQSVFASSPLSLASSATGAQPIAYQWSKDGAVIAGATGAILAFASIQTANAGNYTVTATNSQGAITSLPVTVNLYPPIVISAQPPSLNLTAGSFASLAVAATGSAAASYQWLKDGTPIAGAVTSSLTLSNAQPSDSGVYVAKLTTPAGSVSSTGERVVVGSSGGPIFASAPGDTEPVGGYFAASPSLQFTSLPTAFTFYFNGGLPLIGITSAFYLNPVQPAYAGVYTVTAANVQGTASTSGTLTVTGLGGVPLINQPLTAETVVSGSSVSLSVPVSSQTPVTYQWYNNGVAISGATGSTYAISHVFSGFSGQYNVVATNASGSSSSAAIIVTVTDAPTAPPTPAHLINLSSRAQTTAGTGAFVAGFVVGGSGEKNLVVRGIGPALGGFGISGALADPLLTLYNGASQVLDSSSAWGGSGPLAASFAQVGAFALPAGSADAAVYASVPAGNFTAQVAPITSASGVALAELYDADTSTAPSARLVNISSRAVVGTNVLVAGFAIGGTGSETVVIRGVGPALAGFGVPATLSSPVLTVFDSSSQVIATNAGWANDSRLSAAFAKVGAFPFPANSADDAVILTLTPGTYTAQVSGASGTTGAALVEIYEDN